LHHPTHYHWRQSEQRITAQADNDRRCQGRKKNQEQPKFQFFSFPYNRFDNVLTNFVYFAQLTCSMIIPGRADLIRGRLAVLLDNCQQIAELVEDAEELSEKPANTTAVITSFTVRVTTFLLR
jgi:hypothetical protein